MLAFSRLSSLYSRDAAFRTTSFQISKRINATTRSFNPRKFCSGETASHFGSSRAPSSALETPHPDIDRWKQAIRRDKLHPDLVSYYAAMDLNRHCYWTHYEELAQKHWRQVAVIAKGELVGIVDSLPQAQMLCEEAGVESEHSLIVTIGGEFEKSVILVSDAPDFVPSRPGSLLPSSPRSVDASAFDILARWTSMASPHDLELQAVQSFEPTAFFWPGPRPYVVLPVRPLRDSKFVYPISFLLDTGSPQTTVMSAVAEALKKQVLKAEGRDWQKHANTFWLFDHKVSFAEVEPASHAEQMLAHENVNILGADVLFRAKPFIINFPECQIVLGSFASKTGETSPVFTMNAPMLRGVDVEDLKRRWEPLIGPCKPWWFPTRSAL